MVTREILENTKYLLGDLYVNAFLQRTVGSTWSISQEQFLAMDWQEFTPHCYVYKEGCIYYEAPIPSNIEAHMGVLIINSTMNLSLPKIRQMCAIRQGKHGRELITCLESPNRHKNLRFCNCVVGLHEGKQIIYTAHPGNVTATIKSFPEYKLEDFIELSLNNVPFGFKVTSILDVLDAKQEMGKEYFLWILNNSQRQDFKEVLANNGFMINFEKTFTYNKNVVYLTNGDICKYNEQVRIWE